MYLFSAEDTYALYLGSEEFIHDRDVSKHGKVAIEEEAESRWREFPHPKPVHLVAKRQAIVEVQYR